MSIIPFLTGFVLGLFSLKFNKIMFLIKMILSGYITFMLLHWYDSSYYLLSLETCMNDAFMYKYLLQPFIWECLLLTFIIYLLLYVVIKRIIEIIIDNSKLKKSMEHFFTSLDGEERDKFNTVTKELIDKCCKVIFAISKPSSMINNNICSYNNTLNSLSGSIVLSINIILILLFIFHLYLIVIIMSIVLTIWNIYFTRATLGIYNVIDLINDGILEYNNRLYK